MATSLLTPDRQRTGERAKRPPTTSIREAPFKLVRDATADGQPNDGLTLDGYGAVFNSLTTIDSWEGRFREQIALGSMKRSFRETPPKIQFDHGRHPLIGSLPVASLVSVTEDTDPELAPDGGAHIIGRLLDNWLVEPVRDAIAARAVDGMSFRFEVVREAWTYADGKPIKTDNELYAELDRCYFGDVPDEELPIRTLRELKVPEMGPVTWPAYDDTTVSVRSKVIDLGRLNEPGQRKLLARAVFLADALDANPETQRAQDSPNDTDTDDDPAALAQSLDAVLDHASELVKDVDTTTLPPEVAQALALVTAADAVSDQLLAAMGVYDADDDDDSVEQSPRSSGAQLPARDAGQHPPTTGSQRPAENAGERQPTDTQRPADNAGERQSIPRGNRAIDLWVGRSRDVLLSIQAKRGIRP